VSPFGFQLYPFTSIIYLSKMKRYLPIILLTLVITACNSPKPNEAPVVGFVDAFEDATIAQARVGFTDALKQNGFSEDKKTVQIEYRNAQGNIPTLTQIVNYFVVRKRDFAGYLHNFYHQ
jgi:putative ABC transport system substrate-binding protein